jgi:nitrate/nitrite-specific signal transduction histidine kinase
MLELKIQCEDLEQARVYLNAHQYLNLLQDLQNNLRNVLKHGTDADVVKAVNNFYPDLCKAVDHSQGPY